MLWTPATALPVRGILSPSTVAYCRVLPHGREITTIPVIPSQISSGYYYTSNIFSSFQVAKCLIFLAYDTYSQPRTVSPLVRPMRAVVVGVLLWVGPCQTIEGGLLGMILGAGPCQTVEGGLLGVY